MVVIEGDGNGWVVSASGERRWGRYGAAGLLLRAADPADPDTPLVLLQHRAVAAPFRDAMSKDQRVVAHPAQPVEKGGLKVDILQMRIVALRRGGAFGQRDHIRRRHVRQRRHYMCPTSSGISKNVGWR